MNSRRLTMNQSPADPEGARFSKSENSTFARREQAQGARSQEAWNSIFDVGRRCLYWPTAAVRGGAAMRQLSEENPTLGWRGRYRRP
jgi:hypothetical protein